MTKMSKKANSHVDGGQKKLLLQHASMMIEAFIEGLEPGSSLPFAQTEYGFSFFDGYTVHYTKSFLEKQTEFTRLAAKILKARAAHEPTIRTLCRRAAQNYVLTVAVDGTNDADTKALNAEAQLLVETVLEEISKVYTHIEANFLVALSDFNNTIELGRVRIMAAGAAGKQTPLSGITKIKLNPGHYGEDFILPDGGYLVGMPQMIWVVEAPATMENVAEESKWLIDVAVSFMRLSSRRWPATYPKIGEIETHPIRPTVLVTPHVTFHGDMSYTGGHKIPPIYEINKEVASDLQALACQKKAKLLFDPPAKSLATRVAQGLGWLTRGRQDADRAERLLSFFTAVEALLTSPDKTDPVTQTISRFVSVIYAQNLADRISVFNSVKSLYGLRSAVVHAGKREVLWEDVNRLQAIVEAVYFIVLQHCDLSMSQDTFAQSLADASHGLPWEFAKSNSV